MKTRSNLSFLFIYKTHQGFSLIELSVVLAILGLAFVGFSKGLSAFQETSRLVEVRSDLELVKNQLINYAEVYKHLPCPDSDSDGRENRNGQSCSVNIGDVPYIDIGLKSTDVVDPWDNNFRYAVNQQTNSGGICDKRQASSMFCNAGVATQTPWFTLIDTPPFAFPYDPGNGNLTVCNQSTNDCATAVNAEIETDQAVAVLVAYNSDGVRTLSDCDAASTANQENCNVDAAYHMALPINSGNDFFDDEIAFITGNEIKAKVLGGRLTWNSFQAFANAESTFEAFDLADGDDPTANNNEDEDRVLVRRNVDTAINLAAGDDYMAIGKDLKLDNGEQLLTGSGDDELFIVGDAGGDILMGNGDDEIVLARDLTQVLKMQNGDDKAWIKGSIQSGSALNMNKGNDVVWLGDKSDSNSGAIDEVIKGGGGSDDDGNDYYDILIIETAADWNELSSSEQANINGFELIIFAEDEYGNRNNCEWANCGS